MYNHRDIPVDLELTFGNNNNNNNGSAGDVVGAMPSSEFLTLSVADMQTQLYREAWNNDDAAIGADQVLSII